MVHGYFSLRLDTVLVAGMDEATGRARAGAIIDVLISGLL